MPHQHTPIDPVSADRLAERGLRLDLVDTTDAAAFEAWLQAETRGFHGAIRSDAEIANLVRDAGHRRTTGVWDDAAVGTAGDTGRRDSRAGTDAPPAPVGTVSSWVAPLSIPGGVDVDAWAISAVTVAPTHRRHGIARALLESELRTARADGVPVAMLTVSEATIYGRYGFAPAARAVDLSIDTRRAGWRGPGTTGRIRFSSIEDLREFGRPLIEEARSRAPGEVRVDDELWAELLYRTGSEREKEALPHLRVIRYDDEAGAPRGFALYRADGGDTDAGGNVVSLLYLCAATDDAYAALWHFLLDLDLVARVKAPLRSVDEPLRWLVDDQRAISVTRDYDHLWLRILDVQAALEARRYSGPGSILFEIDDPLELAARRVLLETDASGAGRVTQLDESIGAPVGASVASLGIAELGALYLGGTSAGTLARASRLTETTQGAADAVDALLHSPFAPWLSIWF